VAQDIKADLLSTNAMHLIGNTERWQKFEPQILLILTKYVEIEGANIRVAVSRVKYAAGLAMRLHQLKQHARKDLLSIKMGVHSFHKKLGKYIEFFEENMLEDWESTATDRQPLDVHLEQASYHIQEISNIVNEIVDITKTKNPSHRPKEKFSDTAVLLAAEALIVPFITIYESQFLKREDLLYPLEPDVVVDLNCTKKTEVFSTLVANFIWATSKKTLQIKKAADIICKSPKLMQLLAKNELEPHFHNSFDFKIRRAKGEHKMK
jgi:hypothetical protein